MSVMKPRRSFEAGHTRKFLLVVDDSQEVESALYYAASRVQRSSGTIVMLYVVEPGQYQHWVGVRQKQLEEETLKAKALFRLFKRKLHHAGFEGVQADEVIRQGPIDEEINKLIADDEDIAILILGAAIDAKGPGPLVSSFGVGQVAGRFPIPITMVPGKLSLEDIKALA